ncbi:MAG: hypothetical protein GY731_17270, partial [Gammaproteobacteria bacterium]|nr:hypothetical protein [Gammaproteobacteria bacterium]
DMGAEKMFGRIMESVADAAAIEALGPVGERIEQMDYMEAGRLLAQFVAGENNDLTRDDQG